MFKADRKKLIVTRIKLLKERGGTYSEIAKLFNKEEFYTLNGGEWSTQYIFNFYNRNKNKPGVLDRA